MLMIKSRFEENLGIVVVSLPALRAAVNAISTRLSTYGSKLLGPDNTDQIATSSAIRMKRTPGHSRHEQHNDDQKNLIVRNGKIIKHTDIDVETSFGSAA